MDPVSYVELRTNTGAKLRVSPLSDKDVDELAVAIAKVVARDGPLDVADALRELDRELGTGGAHREPA